MRHEIVPPSRGTGPYGRGTTPYDPVFVPAVYKASEFPPARHKSSQRFHELLAEVGALHDAKQSDYGRQDDPFANVRATEEWGQPGWVGAMIRATDKLRRLQKLALDGSLANEAAEDSFKDLACYALIALVLFEEANDADQDERAT